MDDLLQAFGVAIVEELLLKVRPWRLGGTTGRRHGHNARRRHLELAVDFRGEGYPRRIRVGPGTETASKEGPHSQVPLAETEGIGGEAVEIRRGLIEKGIPGFRGSPRFDEPKQVNRGFNVAAKLVSVPVVVAGI